MRLSGHGQGKLVQQSVTLRGRLGSVTGRLFTIGCRLLTVARCLRPIGSGSCPRSERRETVGRGKPAVFSRAQQDFGTGHRVSVASPRSIARRQLEVARRGCLVTRRRSQIAGVTDGVTQGRGTGDRLLRWVRVGDKPVPPDILPLRNRTGHLGNIGCVARNLS